LPQLTNLSIGVRDVKYGFAILLFVIALAAAYVFVFEYNNYTSIEGNYTSICGQEYNYPLETSKLVYRLDYSNEGVFSSNGTLKVDVKPVNTIVCNNPSLYLGITTSEWSTGNTVVWEEGTNVPPAFVVMAVHPLPSSYKNSTVVPNFILGGILVKGEETPVQTNGGVWPAVHYQMPSGTTVLNHPQYGQVMVNIDQYYDKNTLIPVYSSLKVDIPSINESMNYESQLVSHSNPLQFRMNLLTITGWVAGFAMILGFRELVEE
jgi:tetrahydromethanopterin S-methyltransferase subunit F